MRTAKLTSSTGATPSWETKREVPDKSRVAEPGIPKTQKETIVDVLTDVRFWGGLSALVALISLALPWWGVTIVPLSYSYSWGLLFGPHTQPQSQVIFSQDQLDKVLAANYSIMTGLIILTTLATIVSASLKRLSLLVLSLVLSIVTVLSFLGAVSIALSSECPNPAFLGGNSCMSGFVGQGAFGSNTILWGFQAGFYVFLASTILLFGTLALARTRQG